MMVSKQTTILQNLSRIAFLSETRKSFARSRRDLIIENRLKSYPFPFYFDNEKRGNSSPRKRSGREECEKKLKLIICQDLREKDIRRPSGTVTLESLPSCDPPLITASESCPNLACSRTPGIAEHEQLKESDASDADSDCSGRLGQD